MDTVDADEDRLAHVHIYPPELGALLASKGHDGLGTRQLALHDQCAMGHVVLGCIYFLPMTSLQLLYMLTGRPFMTTRKQHDTPTMQIVDLLQKFAETLDSGVEVDNLQKTQAYQEECNALLKELQDLSIDFPVVEAEELTSQIEQLKMKIRSLTTKVQDYEKYEKDLRHPIAQLQQHVGHMTSQIKTLEDDMQTDQEHFDLDIKLFQELGVFKEDDTFVAQQDHKKMFTAVPSSESHWAYLYE